MTEAFTGHNGRKLSKSAQRRAEMFAERGLTGLDDPGRRGRPRGVASLMALKTGKPERTVRRHMAIGNGLLYALDVHPSELAGTSLSKLTEIRALCWLPKREALVLIKAAKRGRRVSAAKRYKAKRSAEENVRDEVNALIGLFTRTSPEGRNAFTAQFLAFLRGEPQT